MRTLYRSDTLDLMFSIISELGEKYSVSFLVAVSFLYMDLPKAFMVTLTNNAALAALSLLKSINHQPRPFHVM